MSATTRLPIVPAGPAAAPAARVRPTETQSTTLQRILWSCPDLVTGGDLRLVYTAGRRTEAAWLCAYARAAGVTVDLRETADSADELVAAVASADASTVLVIADRELSLPQRGRQLPGTASVNAVDLWEPMETVEAAIRRRCDMLGPTVTVGQPDATLSATITGHRVGHPFGCIDIDISAASGVFVADAAISINRPVRWDARLRSRPVTLSIDGGRLVDMGCDDEALRHFLVRATTVHRADRATLLRVGVRRGIRDVDPGGGLVNSCRDGITLRLSVDPANAYNKASADLQIDFITTGGGCPDGDGP